MGVQPDFHAVVVPRLTAPRLAAVRTDLAATVETGGDILELVAPHFTYPP